MDSKPKVLFMPIGELRSEKIKTDLKAVETSLGKIDIDLTIMSPLYNEKKVIEAARRLKAEEVDLLVLVALHGACAPLLVLAAEHSEVRTVIWAFPARYSLPTAASAIGVLKEEGLESTLVFGSGNDQQIPTVVKRLARVAFTVNRLRRVRIGKIGGVFNLMTASYYDKNRLRQRLGPDVVRIPISDFKESLSKVTAEEVNHAMEKILQPIDVDKAILGKAMKQHLALKQIVSVRGLDGVTLECHSELIKEFAINPCLGFIENTYVIGCEGDVISCAAILMLQYLTGLCVTAADPFTIDGNDVMTMVHCAGPAEAGEHATIERGASPSHVGKPVPLAMCRPRLTSDLEVTLVRLYGINLDKLHVARGRITASDAKGQLNIKIKLHGGRTAFINHMSGNHYIIVPGDIREDLGILAENLKIQILES
jgi:L-fucose isomerase-like protein